MAEKIEVKQPSPIIETLPKLLIDNGIIFSFLLLLVFYKSILVPRIERIKVYLATTFNQDKEIFSLTYQLLALSNSDRVLLGIFHNGDISNSNYHLRKVTMTHEALAPGVSSIGITMQSTPVAIYFASEIENISKYEKEFVKYIVSDLPEGFRRSFLRAGGVRCGYLRLLIYDSKPLGIISIQYNDLGKVLDALSFERCNQLSEMLVDVLSKTDKNSLNLLIDYMFSRK